VISLGSSTAPVVWLSVLGLAVWVAHRSLPPRLASRFLTISLVSAVVVIVPTVALVALAFLAHVPVVGVGFRWCAMAMGMHGAVPLWLGLPAVGFLAVGLARSVLVLRRHRHLRCTHRSGVEVVADDRPYAVTLPGAGGQILVSRGLVDLLDAAETEVVLAHERAHAHYRHDRYLLIAALASALVPPLRLVADRLRWTVERWADEAAARTCGDRRLVAETLSRVALHTVPTPGLAGFGGSGVVGRVRALLQPPAARPSRAVVAGLWGVLVVVLALGAHQLQHLGALAEVLCRH
jgi:Zn-dependent protease with chaperone function